MRHHYIASQWVPYGVSEVFAFFANPQNLAPLMPSWQQVRMEGLLVVDPPLRPPSLPGPAPKTIVAGAGTRMTIRFRPVPLVPIRLAWDAKITEFAWNDHFCDEQERRGPFAYWKHCHQVKEELREGKAGTLITDQLTYELPLGLLGEVAHALGAAAQIRSLFRYRQKRLLELLASDPRQPGRPQST
ncbi:MAG: SRPBCC family protein [Acidobacteriaceae bacterium]